MGHMVIEQALTLEETNVAATLDPSTEWSLALSGIVTGDRVVVNTLSDGVTSIFPHEIYEAIEDGATEYPPTNPSKWVRVSATNAHRMFDGRNNSRTVATETVGEDAGSIVASVYPSGRPKFVYMIGLRDVRSVKVEIEYTVSGETITDVFESDLLISYTATGFYSWMFDIKAVDRSYRRSAGFFIVTQPAPVFSPKITVTLRGSTELPAQCGQLVVGTGFWLGDTEWGVEPTLKDYSTFEANDFGDKEFVPRQNVREIQGTLWVPTNDYDRVFQLFESRINQLALFDFNNGDDIGASEVKDALRVYGKLTSISGGLQYNKTPINLRIEGNS